MSMKNELKIIGNDIIWILLSFVLIFTVILITRQERDLFMISMFFEIIIPVLGAIACSFLLNIENDPTLEILLTTKINPLSILMNRYLVVILEIVSIITVYMILLDLFYLEFTLTSVFLSMVVTLLFMTTLSVTMSITFNSSTFGSLISIFYWVFNIVAQARLSMYWIFKGIFLFGYHSNYEYNYLLINKSILIILSLIMWIINSGILKNKEKLIL